MKINRKEFLKLVGGCGVVSVAAACTSPRRAVESTPTAVVPSSEPTKQPSGVLNKERMSSYLTPGVAQGNMTLDGRRYEFPAIEIDKRMLFGEGPLEASGGDSDVELMIRLFGAKADKLGNVTYQYTHAGSALTASGRDLWTLATENSQVGGWSTSISEAPGKNTEVHFLRIPLLPTESPDFSKIARVLVDNNVRILPMLTPIKDDAAMAVRIISPRSSVSKEYWSSVRGSLQKTIMGIK